MMREVFGLISLVYIGFYSPKSMEGLSKVIPTSKQKSHLYYYADTENTGSAAFFLVFMGENICYNQ